MPSSSPSYEPIPLNAVIATLWRHRLVAAGVGFAVAVAVTLASYAVTPMYRAQAMLVVERGGKPLAFLADEAEAKGTEFSLLNTQSALLMSQQVLEQALDGEKALFASSPTYAQSKDRVNLLRSRISVETNQFNWIINLSLVDSDPELAVAALDSLIRAHLDSERKRIEGRSRTILDFLRQAVAKAREDLERCRTEEAAFRRSNAILSTYPERNQLTFELESLNASRVSLATELIASGATMQGLSASDALADPAARREALLRVPEIHSDALVMKLRQSMLELRNRQFVLSQKYKPEHPQMLELNGQIADTQAQIDGAINDARAGLAYHNDVLTARAEQLKARVSAIEGALTIYRERLLELQALGLRTASTAQLYQTLDRNLQEEEINSHRQRQVVTLADAPHVTSWPVNLRRSLFMLAGLVFGLGAAVVSALVVEFFDRRIRHPAAVRQITGLPTLGFIPHVTALQPPGAYGATPQPGHEGIDESFRLLGSTIQLTERSKKEKRVLVVTSPGGGDGRTTVAARLALALAASGSRVLLIDGDLRQPALHRQFKLPDEPGVSDLLQGREAVVVPTGHPNLELLSAGDPAGRSMELPGIDAFRDLLETFSGNNRFIVIDSPPLEFSEALVVSGLADDILVVIRDGFTAKDALRQAQMRLDPLMGKVLGLIINDDHEAISSRRGPDVRIAKTGVFVRSAKDKSATAATKSGSDMVVIEGL